LPRKLSSTAALNGFDSKLLYIIMSVVIATIFIVRIKIFRNILNFDMTIIPYNTNFFAYYKLVWIMFITAGILITLIYRMFKYKQGINKDYILLGTSLVIVSTLVSTVLSPLKGLSIWGFYSRNNGLLAYISLFLLIYCISCFRPEKKHITYLVHVVNAVSSVLVIIGIFQFFGTDIMNSQWYKQIYVPAEYKNQIESIFITPIMFTGSSYISATSLVGQPNYFGAYCSIIFPLITAFAINEKEIIKKVLLIIGSIMLFAGTILAYSMGSVVALFISLFILPIFLINKDNYKSFLLMCIGYAVVSAVINKLTNYVAFNEIYSYTIRILNSKLVVPSILAMIVYLALLAFRKKLLKYRYFIVSIVIIISVLFSIIGFVYVINNVAGQHMEMLSSRGYIWHYTNDLVKDNFILGYGPDNLYYVFPQLNSDKEAFMPDSYIDKPHNMYLQVLLDTGILGLIGFMVLLVGALLKANKAIEFEKDVHKNTYIKALMLVVIVYMVQGIVNDNHIAVQPIVYLVIGIGASLIRQTLGSNAVESKQ